MFPAWNHTVLRWLKKWNSWFWDFVQDTFEKIDNTNIDNIQNTF